MKILVGLSGGVDSSVVACLLHDAGHEVIGATMSIWHKDMAINMPVGAKSCFSPHEEQDIASARNLCQKLGIPYHVIDCTEQYQKIVLSNFKSEYLQGRTPNPCVVCNSKIKFDALPLSAQAQGIEFDKFATGHYAKVSYNPITNRYCLQKAQDCQKDQSYFLYRLQQEQLQRILMPLGEYSKDDVRAIARKYGLDVSDKPDSQDFYSGDINDILQVEPQKGNFVDKNGKILGQHQGIWNFTIGQRRGLGISADRPLYVVAINKDSNEVVLGYDEDCQRQSLIASNWSWLSVANLDAKQEVYIKLRSSQSAFEAEYTALSEGRAQLNFTSPQKAIASGQSVVLYDANGYVLGGGIIESSK
ncbi:MAG: tRNA 2-thiouridine(34) synthase MnmA [Alphaproteobacteria bacterium]|nr:tRNA 2-thiouridine(34) synthase MnmA [Alphaproteobacteria bacterium]